MLNALRPQQSPEQPSDETEFRDIHPLTPRSSRRDQQPWTDAASHRSLALSVVGNTDVVLGENSRTMTRDSSAMAVADSTNDNNTQDDRNLAGSGEEEFEETNPLAIVADSNPIPSPRRTPVAESVVAGGSGVSEVPVHIVRKEEVESKIIAWQTAEIAKVNNRFKREEVMINGVESEMVEKANAWLNKMERKLEEQRARAMEKMQNEVAKARRKAEEKRASAEARRGVKVAKVLELCNLMRAVGRAPSKRSFF